MPHARHRKPRERPTPRTVLPAMLLTVMGAAFAGLAAVPSAAEPAGPDVLAFTAVEELAPPPERTFDLGRASRDRRIAALSRRTPAVVAAPSPTAPAPVATPAAPAPKPSPVAQRLRRTTTAKVFGGRCPVPSASFTDTWGAARSGGRSHKGTDLIADTGDPVYAVASGVVDTTYSSNGGYSLYLRAANGDRYFYAHNSSNVASDGERVSAGELIARVGSTGNARGTVPHVHFEREVGGRSVNPYRFLRALC